jgi:P4 family phage/plasmid primase-like protien
MKSKYYNQKECMLKWRSFHSSRGKPLTQATLWKWLKEDSPETFYSYLTKRKDLEKLFELLNNKDAAKYFYNMKPDDYLYNEAMGWFILQRNNTWKVAEKQTPSIIKLHISNTLHEILEPYVEHKQKDFIKQKRDAKNDDEKTAIKKREIEFLTFSNKLYKIMGSSEFINGVIAFLPSFYNDDQLATKIDNNRYLFAFNDCIINLETMEKRNIAPSDYITVTTGYNYPTSIPANKKQVETFLYGIFENQDTLNYFLLTLAFGILGYNRFEEFYVWLGSGSNAKGVMDQMLKKAFGDYYYSVDSTLFTQRSDAKDKPMPALVEARSKRIMVSTEPESDEALQVGFLKKLTGGDSIEARTLYSKNIVSYTPQFTVYLQVNCPPKLSKIDQGIERRLRIVGFPFKFLPAHKVMNPIIHRLGDPDVKDKLSKSDEWRDEFILMLLDLYANNRTLKSLRMPPLVEEATKDYMGDNNKVGNWLAQYYVITNDNKDEIQARQLCTAFLMDTETPKVSDKWFKEMMNFNNIQNKKKHNAVFYTGLVRKEEILVD